MTTRKKPEHPPRTVELILWGDHHEPAQAPWGRPSKNKDLRPAQILSVGFVSAENTRISELVRDIAEDGAIGARVHLMRRVVIARARVAIPAAIWEHVKDWNARRLNAEQSAQLRQLLARRTLRPKLRKASKRRK